jgi:hypothetical protein
VDVPLHHYKYANITQCLSFVSRCTQAKHNKYTAAVHSLLVAALAVTLHTAITFTPATNDSLKESQKSTATTAAARARSHTTLCTRSAALVCTVCVCVCVSSCTPVLLLVHTHILSGYINICCCIKGEDLLLLLMLLLLLLQLLLLLILLQLLRFVS